MEQESHVFDELSFNTSGYQTSATETSSGQGYVFDYECE